MYLLSKNVLFCMVIIIVCITSAQVSGASYYVDSAVAISGDGTSWKTAWNSFAKINWNRIGAGDTLFISGGTSSKFYNETMYINAGNSGTRSDPIVVTKGSIPGHNGSVIVDGGNGRGIVLDNKKYITIQSLEFKNLSEIGGGIKIDHTTGVVVENCTFYVTDHGAVFIQRSDSCRIRSNTITTSSYSSQQTDGIYSQLNTDNIYDNNHIVIRNQNPNPHCDGIQLYVDSNIVVSNNYIEQDNNKHENAQGIYATDCYDVIHAYNNVVYGPYTSNPLIALKILNQGDARLIAYHNTLIGGGVGTLYISNSPQSIVKNNVIVTHRDSGWLIIIENSISSAQNIDYNLCYSPNSLKMMNYNGSLKSWLEWKSMGFEKNGINADPRIKNIEIRDFTLENDSPGVDMGISLGLLYSLDKEGEMRPHGTGWDMGAYEVIQNTISPQAPKNLRIYFTND